MRLEQSVGPGPWDQYISLVLELAYWSTFSLEGYIAQFRYKGEGPGLSLKCSVRLY